MLIRWREMRPLYEEDTGAPTGATPEETPAPEIEASPVADTAELERLRKALKEANAESAKRRKRLEELEAAETSRVQAELSEAEKLKAQLEKLTAEHADAAARLRRATLKDAAQDAAQRAGLTFASGALADAVALGAFDSLEIADDGKVLGITDAVKALHKEKPYLFGAVQPPQAPDINAGARGNGNGTVITDAERARIEARYRHTF